MDWKEIIDRKVTIFTFLGFMGGLLVVYGGLSGKDNGVIGAGLILLIFTGFAWVSKKISGY